MTELSSLLAPELVRPLSWSLLHFLWQGAAIAAVAAALMQVFRASAARYLLGVLSLAAMLVAFGVTFSLLSEAQDALVVAGEPAADTPALGAMLDRASPPLASTAAPEFSFDTGWVVLAWLVGVVGFALRQIR